MRTLVLTAGAILAQTISIHSADSEPAMDKSLFHLFNPTPRTALREMSTDRPDKTESAYTVDAGHFQIEADVVSYSYDHDKANGADTVVKAWSFAPVNLKVGLNNRIDFQTVIETYSTVDTEDRAAGTKESQSGFGDITTRLKINLWGNDGGKTAFAAMPFVKIPTNQDQLGNNSVEGGIILPLAIELPRGFGLGLMTEFDLIRDGVGSGFHPEFINSITISHDLVGNLGGYAEFFSSVSAESGADWIGTVDLGLTYGLTDDIQLDAGVNIGVTKAAEDFNPFIGISFRF